MITDKVGGSSAKPEVSKQSKEKRLKHKVSGYKSQSKRRSIARCRLLLRTLGFKSHILVMWPCSYKLTHFKKMVQVWKTKSLLFCLRYDPLIVFWRQNHITFIFKKMMPFDLLVQMVYWLMDNDWTKRPWQTVENKRSLPELVSKFKKKSFIPVTNTPAEN